MHPKNIQALAGEARSTPDPVDEDQQVDLSWLDAASVSSETPHGTPSYQSFLQDSTHISTNHFAQQTLLDTRDAFSPGTMSPFTRSSFPAQGALDTPSHTSGALNARRTDSGSTFGHSQTDTHFSFSQSQRTSSSSMASPSKVLRGSSSLTFFDSPGFSLDFPSQPFNASPSASYAQFLISQNNNNFAEPNASPSITLTPPSNAISFKGGIVSFSHSPLFATPNPLVNLDFTVTPPLHDPASLEISPPGESPVERHHSSPLDPSQTPSASTSTQRGLLAKKRVAISSPLVTCETTARVRPAKRARIQESSTTSVHSHENGSFPTHPRTSSVMQQLLEARTNTQYPDQGPSEASSIEEGEESETDDASSPSSFISALRSSSPMSADGDSDLGRTSPPPLPSMDAEMAMELNRTSSISSSAEVEEQTSAGTSPTISEAHVAKELERTNDTPGSTEEEASEPSRPMVPELSPLSALSSCSSREVTTRTQNTPARPNEDSDSEEDLSSSPAGLPLAQILRTKGKLPPSVLRKLRMETPLSPSSSQVVCMPYGNILIDANH